MKWKLFSGVLLAVVALGVAMNMKDVKRYIRISMM
jgi:hypothetical protein